MVVVFPERGALERRGEGKNVEISLAGVWNSNTQFLTLFPWKIDLISAKEIIYRLVFDAFVR